MLFKAHECIFFAHVLSVRMEKGDNKGGMDKNHKKAVEEKISTKCKEDDHCTHAADLASVYGGVGGGGDS